MRVRMCAGDGLESFLGERERRRLLNIQLLDFPGGAVDPRISLPMQETDSITDLGRFHMSQSK